MILDEVEHKNYFLPYPPPDEFRKKVFDRITSKAITKADSDIARNWLETKPIVYDSDWYVILGDIAVQGSYLKPIDIFAKSEFHKLKGERIPTPPGG